MDNQMQKKKTNHDIKTIKQREKKQKIQPLHECNSLNFFFIIYLLGRSVIGNYFFFSSILFTVDVFIFVSSSSSYILIYYRLMKFNDRRKKKKLFNYFCLFVCLLKTHLIYATTIEHMQLLHLMTTLIFIIFI